MRISLVVLAIALSLLAVAPASRAQPFYNSFQGASWAPTGAYSGVYPMDLSAAVSDQDSSFPKSGNYLTEFTNGGVYVYNDTTEKQVSSGDQWQFWCSGGQVQDCGTVDTENGPYDTQIAYDWVQGRWITAALSPYGPTPTPDDPNGRGYELYVAASSDASPTDSFYRFSVQACPDFPGTFGDNDNGRQPLYEQRRSRPRRHRRAMLFNGYRKLCRRRDLGFRHRQA